MPKIQIRRTHIGSNQPPFLSPAKPSINSKPNERVKAHPHMIGAPAT